MANIEWQEFFPKWQVEVLAAQSSNDAPLLITGDNSMVKRGN
jgi:hypothetical protein